MDRWFTTYKLQLEESLYKEPLPSCLLVLPNFRIQPPAF